MPRSTQDSHSRLRGEIVAVGSFDKESLIRRPEWGTISLDEARGDMERIFSIVGHLEVLPTEFLTATAMDQISNSLSAIKQQFTAINAFTIESSNPTQQRNSFVANLQDASDTLYTNASPWIPFLAYQQGDTSKNIQSLTASVKEAQNLIDSAKKNIEARGKEIEDIIVAAREASASAGAAIFTHDFNSESRELKDSAKKWLNATMTFSVLTLVVAIAFVFLAAFVSNASWPLVTSKVVLLGVFVTATLWCGRIYKALLHQSATYRHRALSIQTLQAFSAAASDVQVKDAVLAEAARSVFALSNSGFIDGVKEGESDVKIFEIAKNVLPRS